MKNQSETFSSFYLEKEHKQLVCFGVKKCILQFKSFQFDMLTGNKVELGFEYLSSYLDSFKIDSYVDRPVVIHLFYEWGYICENLKDCVDENTPLAIICEYQNFTKKNITPTELVAPTFKNMSMRGFEDYKAKFNSVYENLVKGNCYQTNLTSPFYFKFEEDYSAKEFIDYFFQNKFRLGSYASGTYIQSLDQLFLSNSPECLFQIRKRNNKYEVLSFPIKGTHVVENESERTQSWELLKESKKNQAELFMISDLVCNDLCKLTLNPAVVYHKKYPLHVPGLVHQFSVIGSTIDQNKTLKDVLYCLFPGGSITGAPKHRVMKIIKETENYNRGFYCGSTILMVNNLKTASINIRSAEISFSEKELYYGSGGGITLNSDAESEHEEMIRKLKSFMLLFKK